MNKRLLSLLLACLMLVSLVPTAAFAAVADRDDVIPLAAPAAEEDAAAPAAAEELPAEPVEAETGSSAELAAIGDFIPQYDNNIALNKKVYVSSDKFAGTSNGATKDKVNDGTATGKIGGQGQWVPNDMKGTNAEKPAWVVIDLATTSDGTTSDFTPVDIDSIKIWYNGTNWAQNYKIQTAASYDDANRDATTWTDLATVTRTGANANVTNGSGQTIADTANDCDVITLNSTPALASGAQAQRFVRFYIEEMNSACSYDDMGIVEFQLLTVVPAENLSRLEHVTATASNEEGGTSFTADKVIDGIKDGSSRWSTDQNVTNPWITIDLHRICQISRVDTYWCGDASQTVVNGYTIAVSSTGADGSWTTVKTVSSTVPCKRNPTAEAPVPTVSDSFNTVSGRFVRIQATGYRDNAIETESSPWKNMALWEVEVYGTAGDLIPDEDTPINLAMRSGTNVTASNNEGSGHTPDKANDGDRTTNASRWTTGSDGAGTTERWLQYDLGGICSIDSVALYWNERNVKRYFIETSLNGRDWTVAHEQHNTANPAGAAAHIWTETSSEHTELGVEAARYVRFRATEYDHASGYDNWYNVSLYEFEVYGQYLRGLVPASSIVSQFNASSFEIANGKLVMTDAAKALLPSGFTAAFGVEPEQIVGADGTIYTPLVTTNVKIEVTVVGDTDTANNASSPISFPIPGDPENNNTAAGNPKPAVVPAIMEWYSHGDDPDYLGKSYTLPEQIRIVHRYAFDSVAKELAADLKDLYGIDAEMYHLSEAEYTTLHNVVRAGDIILFDVNPHSTSEDNRNRVQGYDDETYGMEIWNDRVYIYATHATGAYWGTRTLLQGMKLSEDGRSFPNGTLRDYPAFKVRSFILDAGRKPVSMDKLREMAKNMAWYKMNDFHVHLNDNLIFMEDYKQGRTYQQAKEDIDKKAYSAFRLESGLEVEPNAVAPLAARDYHYTKAEYKQFVEDSAKIGVNIVSEIDIPAHAKAITDAFPSVRLYGDSSHPWNDHLDLTGKYEESLAVTKKIFDEYIDEGVFGPYVHFGADEYYDSAVSYRRYMGDMIDYLKTKPNVNIRVWGSLSQFKANQDQYPTDGIDTQNVQMNVWNYGWANPQEMYDLGFDLVNCNDGAHYIVPHSGYYHPNGLGTGGFNFVPNQFSNTWIPASSSQMLGGAYAIWNDCIDTRANGVDEQDLFKLFFDALPYYACSFWGKGGLTLDQAKASVATLSYAPGTNPTNQVERKEGTAQYFRYTFNDTADQSGNDRTLTPVNATVQGGVLSLNGGSSYAEIGLDRLSWGDKLSFRVKKLEGGGAEQVIFEGDHAYGEFDIKAIPVEGDDTKWKLGFSRELYDFVFEDALLPVGEWVTLTLDSRERTTSLLVEGDDTVYIPTGYFLSDENSNTAFMGHTFLSGTSIQTSHGNRFDYPLSAGSSFSIPVARIGSKSNAFKGLVDNVYAAPSASGAPVEDGRYDIPVDQYAQATSGTAQPGSGAGNAIDGDPRTVWHTTWSVTCQPADRWFMIELDQSTLVGGLSYLGTGGANGAIREFRVETSTDGANWTEVVRGGTFANKAEWQSVRFDPVNAKYVRLWADKTDGAQDSTIGTGQFISAAEIRVCRPIRLTDTADGVADGTAAISLDETSYPLVDGKAEPLPLVTFEGAVLVKDTDYTVSYTNNTAAGTATVTVTGKGGYVGSLQANFTVTVPPAVTSLANATVELPDPYPLTGGEARPDPVVKLGDTTLVRGLDYEVTYANNTTTGQTATVTITGIGGYRGTKTATFTVAAAIVTKDLSNSRKTSLTLHQLTFPYEGAAIKPDPVVTYDGETLVKDRDYTVSYSGNAAVGTATVTVTGIQPYCRGYATTTFSIVEPSQGNDLSNAEKTKVVFNPKEYAYTGQAIVPTFTVSYGGKRLTQGVDYTVELSNNINGGTGVLVIRGTGEYYGPFVATFTITGGGTSTTPGGSGGSSGGSSGSSSGGSSGGVTTTTTAKQPDGASVTVKTDATGAMTSTATYPDGAKVTADIPVTGPITAVVTVPAKADKVTVTIPTRGEPTPGQVAVILHPDGTQEIVKTSLLTEDGVSVTLNDSVLLQVVDNTKEFADVPADSWANDAISFVTSREIFNGTGSKTFSPDDRMSRAMVCTVLANLAGEDTKSGSTWYEKGLSWAKEQGVSDTSAPHDIITREQLAVMLYRCAGSPFIMDEVPRRFRDRESVSDWAELAMTWAVQNDLLRGRSSLDGLDLAPQGTATRAEVAAVLQRFVALTAK